MGPQFFWEESKLRKLISYKYWLFIFVKGRCPLKAEPRATEPKGLGVPLPRIKAGSWGIFPFPTLGGTGPMYLDFWPIQNQCLLGTSILPPLNKSIYYSYPVLFAPQDVKSMEEMACFSVPRPLDQEALCLRKTHLYLDLLLWVLRLWASLEW